MFVELKSVKTNHIN